MIPMIIYNFKRKGDIKVWENPWHEMYGIDKHAVRVWVEGENANWQIIGVDDSLAGYWDTTCDNLIAKEEGRLEDIVEPTVTVEQLNMTMSLDEYMDELAFIGIIEDVFQIPFDEKVKELSDLLVSGKYTWRVSPDVSIWHDDEMGLGYDT